MKYDKFRGESLQEILMEIRKKYGQNVYILETKEIQDGGILGTKFLSKKMYEVHVMIPESNAPYSNYSSYGGKNYLGLQSNLRKTREFQKTQTNLSSDVLNLKESIELDKTIENSKNVDQNESKVSKNQEKDFLSDFNDIDNLIRSLQKIREEKLSTNESEEKNEIQTKQNNEKVLFKIEKPTKEELKILFDDSYDDTKFFKKQKEEIWEEFSETDMMLVKVRDKLLKSEFTNDFINKFSQVLKKKLPSEKERNPKEFYSFVIKEISKFVYYEPEIKKGENPKVIFFVGPNGSGKTTSLAKLSAKYKLENHYSISIMSLDDYRLAATEQLKIYSQILDVPFYAPLHLSEFKEFIFRDNSDFVFVDTPGLSIKDRERLLKIKKFIDITEEKEIHLVLSSLMRYDVIEKFIQFFSEINFNKIILTGLDEIKISGFFIELSDKIKKPYSFFMNGQNVPEDIMEIKIEDLVQQILV